MSVDEYRLFVISLRPTSDGSALHDYPRCGCGLWVTACPHAFDFAITTNVDLHRALFTMSESGRTQRAT